MSTLNVRLPEDLEALLAQEAERANKPRSELARDAIRAYLERMERERFMGELSRAAQAIATDPELRQEATDMAREFEPTEDEALESPEGEAEDPWWR